MFTQNCGSCHTLAAASTSGTIGPNLDNAFGPARQQGFKQSTIQNVVLDQIRDRRRADAAQHRQGPGRLRTSLPTSPSVAGTGATSNAKPPSQLGTDGKTIFQSECASCHTLAAAGTHGTIGPNLDQLKPSEAIVQHQVEVGGGVMPAFKSKLSAAQIAAVAKFVSSSAGK